MRHRQRMSVDEAHAARFGVRELRAGRGGGRVSRGEGEAAAHGELGGLETQEREGALASFVGREKMPHWAEQTGMKRRSSVPQRHWRAGTPGSARQPSTWV